MNNIFDPGSLDGVLGIVFCAVLVVSAVITLWRVFVRAGRPGWAAIIPFYNYYTLLKVAKRPGWWLVWYFIPVANVIVHLTVSLGVGKAFNKRAAFGFFLLWLLPFIGYPILAFGDAAYQTEQGQAAPRRSSLRPLQRNLLIGLLVVFLLFSASGTAAAVYYHYQDNRIRQEVTSETTKFQNLSFDTLDEWDSNYRLTVMYPKTDNASIDAAARAKINSYITAFRSLVAKKPANTPPYYLHMVGSVNYASKTAINFVYDGTWTINGKTGDIEVNALFDRASGKEVQAADLFKGSGYLKIASDAARKALPGILVANYNQTRVEQGTTPTASNFDQYEIVDSKTINIIFEPGQVADQTLGTIKVPLTLDSLSSEWNRDTVNKLFPDFIAALQAKEAADAAAAKKAAAEKQAAAAATAQARQAGSYLPAHGNVDCSKAKCIALTFDDGPGPATDTILDTLEKYHAPATFMVVGKQVATHTAQLRREAADGDDIGSHTWDHADLTSLSIAGVQQEVNLTQQAVLHVLGKQPFMLRPPYGAYNQTVLKTVGMPLILWSVDPDDWKDRNADIVHQRVMAHAKPGAIVLSHDLYPTTAAAYQRIIPELINQGYTLVTVSNLESINLASLPLQVFTGKY